MHFASEYSLGREAMVDAESLVRAAQFGDLETVSELLARGSDPNVPVEGTTALWWAAQEGHTEVVDALLEAGADVDFVDRNGSTPLKQAVGERHTDIAERLLLRGADFHHRFPSDGGCMVLHTAAAYGRMECIRLLLLYGADPCAKNDDGQTPYDTAIECGETEAAEVLRGAQAA